jgi:hypothetical protein
MICILASDAVEQIVGLLLMSLRLKATGIAWYKPEDYDRLRQLFSDGENLPGTYAEWLSKAQNLFDQLVDEGLTVEKVYINPDTFPGWCAVRGLDINSKARVRFANESVYRQYRE